MFERGGQMNLSVLQIQALSMLVRNVEMMIELYWDTENGARLSQSLPAIPGCLSYYID